ncbi:MAG: TIGR04053 family radical SAM/SPASM domain-containing protein [Thermoprotei archaeon]
MPEDSETVLTPSPRHVDSGLEKPEEKIPDRETLELPSEPLKRFEKSPVLLFWEMTAACPLLCLHCRASSLYTRSPSELGTVEAMVMLDTIASFEPAPPTVVFTGGDPLMRDDLFELLDYSRALGIRTAVSPAVSEMLSQDTLRALRDLDVTSISVSLDGSTRQLHDEIRGVQGTYDMTLAAVRTALALGLKVQVNSVVMSRNFQDLPHLFHLVKSLGVPVWELFFIIVTGRAYSALNLDAPKFEEAARFAIEASRRIGAMRVVEAPFTRRLLYSSTGQSRHGAEPEISDVLVKIEGETSREPSLPRRGTLDGDGTMFVSRNGDIYPGGLLPVKLGNVRNTNLVKVYSRNKLLRKIRSRSFTGPCGTCAYRFVCGGSRARSYAHSGSPLGSDPACIYGQSAEFSVA